MLAADQERRKTENDAMCALISAIAAAITQVTGAFCWLAIACVSCSGLMVKSCLHTSRVSRHSPRGRLPSLPMAALRTGRPSRSHEAALHLCFLCLQGPSCPVGRSDPHSATVFVQGGAVTIPRRGLHELASVYSVFFGSASKTHLERRLRTAWCPRTLAS